MAYVSTAFVNRQEIDAAVQRAEKALAPKTVRIRYSLGPDWEGEPSIFFRVVLADEFAKKSNFADTAEAVSIAVMNEANTDERGLHTYFRYRSLSDQNEINEPEW